MLFALRHIFARMFSSGPDHDPATPLPVVGLDVDAHLNSMHEPLSLGNPCTSPNVWLEGNV